MLERVSAVVPTHQSIRTIEACLSSLRNQRRVDLEVVVVDNHSLDGTWEVAQRLAHVALRTGPERSQQRNAGVAASSGQWVMYVDSDMVLPPEVVGDALDAARHADAEAVFVPEITVGEGFWARCRALERDCYAGEPRIESPRLIRRSWLVDHGVFTTDLIGQEDADIRQRLRASGAALARSRNPIIHDEGRLTFKGVMAKRFYYGRTLPAYRRAHPGAMSEQAGAALSAYWKHRHALARQPHLAGGLLILRSLELVAYGAGALAGSFNRGQGVG
jgi:glycosyltransferase involved in cell wall biosynthesis